MQISDGRVGFPKVYYRQPTTIKSKVTNPMGLLDFI